MSSDRIFSAQGVPISRATRLASSAVVATAYRGRESPYAENTSSVSTADNAFRPDTSISWKIASTRDRSIVPDASNPEKSPASTRISSRISRKCASAASICMPSSGNPTTGTFFRRSTLMPPATSFPPMKAATIGTVATLARSAITSAIASTSVIDCGVSTTITI